MSEVPAWVESLIDLVAGCMEAHSGVGPLAFRWREEDDQWDIMVYPTPDIVPDERRWFLEKARSAATPTQAEALAARA